jgi:hypothetical protein
LFGLSTQTACGHYALQNQWEYIPDDRRPTQITKLYRLLETSRTSQRAIIVEVIQAALGKVRLEKSSWGIAGQVPLGIELDIPLVNAVFSVM